jgi:hypothetical protein
VGDGHPAAHAKRWGRPLIRIALALFGALMMVAGIAARIVAAGHAPGRTTLANSTGYCVGACATRATGWPQTTYDLVRISGWALIIFGALVVAVALIREFRTAS